MTMTYWGLWLGARMVGAASLTGQGKLSVGAGVTVTDFTPPPPPATSTDEVVKVRYVRDTAGNSILYASKVVSGVAGLYQQTAMPANGGTITLGTKYKDLFDANAFDANPAGGLPADYSGTVLAYCTPSRQVNYETRMRHTSWTGPVVYAGSMPLAVQSTRVSVGAFGADVLSSRSDLTQPPIYNFEELIPDVLEVQDQAGAYTEVYDTGKRLTRVPKQWAYEKWHNNLYKHEVYHTAVYKEQAYTPAKYEKQVWQESPGYTETYQGQYTAYYDISNNIADKNAHIRNLYINPYLNPCYPYGTYTADRSFRREEVSIVRTGAVFAGTSRYRLIYKEWRARCPSTDGVWVNTGEFIYTDTPPSNTSTIGYVLRAPSYWTDTGRVLTTDTPPASTGSLRWVVVSSSRWEVVEQIELTYIPTNTSTDRWTLITAAYWERLSSDTYNDGDLTASAPAGFRYVKVADAYWRPELAADASGWTRRQVTAERWLKQCSWHPAGMPTRAAPAYSFWRRLPDGEAVAGRPTRVMLAGGWEPWVPTSLGQTAPSGVENVVWRKSQRFPTFDLSRYLTTPKGALLLHTDAGTFLAHGNSLLNGGWQTSVAYRVSADVGHFTTAALEDGIAQSLTALGPQTWTQVYDPPVYRIKEWDINWEFEEPYKLTENNGTYYTVPTAAIDAASTTVYYRSPEAYASELEGRYPGKEIGWYSLTFTDTGSPKGGTPIKGSMSGGYYVIQKPWAVKWRARVIPKTMYGDGESLDGRIYRSNGAVSRDRKVRPGEDLAGQTLVTVKNGAWRYLYPGEDPAGRATQSATYQTAQSHSMILKLGLFTQGGKVKSAKPNPADYWQGDRISSEMNLPFLSCAAAPATMRGRTSTEARYIVIGEGADGIYHCVVEVAMDGTMALYRPLTRLSGAPRGRVIRIGYPYTTGGDAVAVLVDAYQSGGLRQYAVFGVRNVYTNAGPYLPGNPVLVEAAAGPVDHDYAADATFAGTSCRVAFRDRTTRLLLYAQVTITL